MPSILKQTSESKLATQKSIALKQLSLISIQKYSVIIDKQEVNTHICCNNESETHRREVTHISGLGDLPHSPRQVVSPEVLCNYLT